MRNAWGNKDGKEKAGGRCPGFLFSVDRRKKETAPVPLRRPGQFRIVVKDNWASLQFEVSHGFFKIDDQIFQPVGGGVDFLEAGHLFFGSGADIARR